VNYERSASQSGSDSWDAPDRGYVLATSILPDLFASSYGMFTEADIFGSKRVLDIPCGVGGLAAAARRVGSQSVFVGVDSYDYGKNSKAVNAHSEYEAIHIADITETGALDHINLKEFDLIFSMCTTPEVNLSIAKMMRKGTFSSKAKIVLVSDLILDTKKFPEFVPYWGTEFHYAVMVHSNALA
jgi:SAM-dependent methyltransferase